MRSKLYGGELKYETLKQGFETISDPEKSLRVIEFLKRVNCKIDNNGPVIITLLAFDYILKQLSNVVRMDKIPFVGAYIPGLVGVYVERSYLDGLITSIGNVNRLYPGITFITMTGLRELVKVVIQAPGIIYGWIPNYYGVQLLHVLLWLMTVTQGIAGFITLGVMGTSKLLKKKITQYMSRIETQPLLQIDDGKEKKKNRVIIVNNNEMCLDLEDDYNQDKMSDVRPNFDCSEPTQSCFDLGIDFKAGKNKENGQGRCSDDLPISENQVIGVMKLTGIEAKDQFEGQIAKNHNYKPPGLNVRGGFQKSAIKKIIVILEFILYITTTHSSVYLDQRDPILSQANQNYIDFSESKKPIFNLDAFDTDEFSLVNEAYYKKRDSHDNNVNSRLSKNKKNNIKKVNKNTIKRRNRNKRVKTWDDLLHEDRLENHKLNSKKMSHPSAGYIIEKNGRVKIILSK